MNHWIESTPSPKPTNAQIVNAHDFLLKRIRAFRKERAHLPNLVAVDFDREGDLVAVAHELNEEPLSRPKTQEMTANAADEETPHAPPSGIAPPSPWRSAPRLPARAADPPRGLDGGVHRPRLRRPGNTTVQTSRGANASSITPGSAFSREATAVGRDRRHRDGSRATPLSCARATAWAADRRLYALTEWRRELSPALAVRERLARLHT
jgi:hypothetical protein